MYQTPDEILAEMLAEHQALTGVELAVTDVEREEVIKMKPFAAAISAYTAKLKRNRNARHPDTSDELALEHHLASKQLPGRIQPQKSDGTLRLTSSDEGIAIVAGEVVAQRVSDGSFYTAISSGVVAGGQVDVVFESNLQGQNQNEDKLNEQFIITEGPSGLDIEVVNTTIFANGRDLESASDMLSRIKKNDRNEDTGGNDVAYEGWATDASPAVVAAKAIKHRRGVGTTDVVITSGTTDIEAAVRNGDAVVRQPSASLITEVQAYVDIKKPTTDDSVVLAPTEENFDVTVLYRVTDELQKSKVEDEITKIWQIFTYSAKPGEELFPTELERLIDQSIGELLEFRRVQNFTPGYSKVVGSENILNPNQLTLTEV